MKLSFCLAQHARVHTYERTRKHSHTSTQTGVHVLLKQLRQTDAVSLSRPKFSSFFNLWFSHALSRSYTHAHTGMLAHKCPQSWFLNFSLVWLSSPFTQQTLAPPLQSSPGRSTCWFFWWEKGVGHHRYQPAVPQPPGNRCWAPPHNQMYNCVQSPDRAPPTLGNSSDIDGCHPVIGCAGLWSSEISCQTPSE